MAKQVLIVATSHALLGDTGSPTGCWVEEISSPYYAFKAAGFQVTISSILGGAIPFDPASKSGDFLTASAAQFLADGAL
jgi:putative intracellular protease/amidase